MSSCCTYFPDFHQPWLLKGLLPPLVSVFISPRDRVAQLYPQAPGTHFSCLLQYARATVGLFFLPVTTWGLLWQGIHIMWIHQWCQNITTDLTLLEGPMFMLVIMYKRSNVWIVWWSAIIIKLFIPMVRNFQCSFSYVKFMWLAMSHSCKVLHLVYVAVSRWLSQFQ
jgi:hypothetical protein